MYDFEPQEAGELQMKKGDHIIVIDKGDKNWWRGRIGNREGLFPVPYIKEIDD